MSTISTHENADVREVKGGDAGPMPADKATMRGPCDGHAGVVRHGGPAAVPGASKPTDKGPNDEPAMTNEGQWEPFPVAVLPEPVDEFVDRVGAAIGYDPSYVALPLLSTLGAAIGNTRHLRIKRGWVIPPIVWTAIVGESGTGKSAALRHVFHFIRQRELLEFKKYQNRLRGHQQARGTAPGGGRGQGAAAIDPAPRYLVQDVTIEALAPVLEANARGVLLAVDELATWFGSFDRYRSGKGSADVGHWLSIYDADLLQVDRKTGEKRRIVVPAAGVWVTGSIQPGVLRRLARPEYFESGLLARVLWAWPPRRPRQWAEEELDEQTTQRMEELFARLYELDLRHDGKGALVPLTLEMSAKAKEAWVDFFNRHNAEQAELDDELAPAFAKLEECAARLALIVHVVREVGRGTAADASAPVDVQSIEAGIALAEWFKRETRRVYGRLSESQCDAAAARLIRWIETQGGTTTTREVQRHLREYRSASDVRAALNDLARRGLGSWSAPARGRRGGPERFTLSRRVETAP